MSTHWSLLYLDLSKGVAFHLDSSTVVNGRSAEAAALFAANIFRIRNETVSDSFQTISVKCPQQSNGYDCGIYALLYADCVSKLLVTLSLLNDIKDKQQYIEEELEKYITLEKVDNFKATTLSDIMSLARTKSENNKYEVMVKETEDDHDKSTAPRLKNVALPEKRDDKMTTGEDAQPNCVQIQIQERSEPLTDEERTRVDNALERPISEFVLITKFAADITVRLIQSLKETVWLNDEVPSDYTIYINIFILTHNLLYINYTHL
jgi:Ulp1 family protease